MKDRLIKFSMKNNEIYEMERVPTNFESQNYDWVLTIVGIPVFVLIKKTLPELWREVNCKEYKDFCKKLIFKNKGELNENFDTAIAFLDYLEEKYGGTTNSSAR